MGIISKGLSAFLRFMAFVSSVIVAGLLGRFVHHEHKMGLSGGSRTLFVLSLSGISIFFSLLLMIPFAFTFWSFPLDFAMFVMWIVGFGLLAGVCFPPPPPLSPSLSLLSVLGGSRIAHASPLSRGMRETKTGRKLTFEIAGSKVQRAVAHVGMELLVGPQPVRNLALRPRLHLHCRHVLARQHAAGHVPILQGPT